MDLEAEVAAILMKDTCVVPADGDMCAETLRVTSCMAFQILSQIL